MLSSLLTRRLFGKLAILACLSTCCLSSARATQTFGWNCQDNAASTTVLAQVGGVNGTLNTDTTAAMRVTGPGGLFPFALQFNGTPTTGHMATVSATVLSAAGPNSVVCWFKAGAQTSDAGSSLRSIWAQSNSDQASLGLYRTGHANVGRLDIRWFNAGGALTSPAATYADATWRHAAVVRSGTTITTYIDGSPIGTATGTNAAAGDFTIGGDTVNGSRRFAGALADIRVFDHAISAAEISTIRADGATATQAPRAFYLNQMKGQ